MTTDFFSLHMNTTYTLHVYHIHYTYYDLPMIMYMYINAAVNPIELYMIYKCYELYMIYKNTGHCEVSLTESDSRYLQ